jgi:hypothetical protein
MTDSGRTPPLCERCWFPIADDHPVRSRMTPDDEVVLIGFEHAEQTCTPQQPNRDRAA